MKYKIIKKILTIMIIGIFIISINGCSKAQPKPKTKTKPYLTLIKKFDTKKHDYFKTNECNEIYNRKGIRKNQLILDFGYTAKDVILFGQISSNISLHDPDNVVENLKFGLNSSIKPIYDNDGNRVNKIRLFTSIKGHKIKDKKSTIQLVYNIAYFKTNKFKKEQSSYSITIGNSTTPRHYDNKPNFDFDKMERLVSCVNITYDD